MRRIAMLAGLLALAGCAASTSHLSTPSAAPIASAPDKSDAIFAIAGTAASVADAIGAAPPATLAKTTIDDKAIRVAYQTFDAALTVVDSFVATGAIVPGSPRALALKRAILATQAALNAASAAQRAGSATTYTSALRNAETALADARAALAQ